MEQEALNTRRIIYGLAVSFLGIVVLRIVFPERSLDQTGLRALLDSFFALCLLAGVLLLAAGVGARALRLLRISSLSNSEQILFSTSLGLGILAYLILALALIGLLNPWLIFLIFVLLGIWLKRDLVQSLLRVREMLGELWRTVRAGPIYLTTFIVLGGLVALLSLFQALTPPTGVDGLIYHLPVPQLYLNAGRMIPTPDFTPAAFPSAIEMLFAIGQAFGSDVFSQLIHLTYLGFFVGGTILAGRRFLGESGGWLAAAILLGMPVLPIWGVLPYIDIAWALYEFLAIYFLLIWVKKANASAYVLSGILCGLAVGSKYLALGGFASAVLVILLNVRRDGLFSTARNVLVFSLTAILVASPWYLRNWLWYGNPFYPFYQGLFGGSLDPMSGLSSHQLNYGIIDYLLIPLRLIVDRKQFVGVYGSIEFLSPFFLLFLVYPFMRRKNSLDRLAVFALIRYVGWVATTPT
ncbi:MAG: glycosyltransferase family 39 protein, partial [Anaerolineales bacterium]